MKDKIRFIFIPFLIVLFSLIIGYTFLNWLIFIELELLSLKKFITNWVLPILLVGLLVVFFLRSRLKILKFKKKDRLDFYTFVLWILLTVPLIISQEYIETATGKLTKLNSINEIKKTKLTKFYTLKNYYIDKKHFASYARVKTSGKHRQYYDMDIYIAMPIFENENEALRKKALAYLALNYHKQISNRLKQKEKDTQFRTFAQECEKDFDNKDVSNFIYLDRIGNTEKRDGYINALKEKNLYNSNTIILVAKNKAFESRNGKKLEWLFVSILIGCLILLLLIYFPDTSVQELDRIKNGMPDIEAQKEWKDFLEFLTPKEGFLITPILIYINLGIFILMAIMGLGFIDLRGPELLKWGANFRPYTTNGQWWRLLTSCFLHSGFVHLFANLCGLLFVGLFLEPVLGKWKYLTAYLLAGIFSSIASILWYSAAVSVGASGAIFGLYGVFISLLLTKKYSPEFTKTFLVSIIIFVAYNLLIGLRGGVDNAGHIGGLISGFLIGLIFSIWIKQEN